MHKQEMIFISKDSAKSFLAGGGSPDLLLLMLAPNGYFLHESMQMLMYHSTVYTDLPEY